MKQIAIFPGIDTDDLEKDINEWIAGNRIEIVDVKVNMNTFTIDGKDQTWYVFTVVYHK